MKNKMIPENRITEVLAVRLFSEMLLAQSVEVIRLVEEYSVDGIPTQRSYFDRERGQAVDEILRGNELLRIGILSIEERRAGLIADILLALDLDSKKFIKEAKKVYHY